MHAFPSAGSFIRRPIRRRADHKALEVEFIWLEKENRSQDTRVDLLVMSKTTPAATNAGNRYKPMLRTNEKGSRILTSGTRFLIETEDPEDKSLPDVGLLVLQYYLQRVLAMSGAAGWDTINEFRDESSDDDDDDDDDRAVLEPHDKDDVDVDMEDESPGHEVAAEEGTRMVRLNKFVTYYWTVTEMIHSTQCS
jgi:hypothetical protein